MIISPAFGSINLPGKKWRDFLEGGEIWQLEQGNTGLMLQGENGVLN